MITYYLREKAENLEKKLKNFIGNLYVPILKSPYDSHKPSSSFFNASKYMPVFDSCGGLAYHEVRPYRRRLGLVPLKSFKSELKKNREDYYELLRHCSAATRHNERHGSHRGPFPAFPWEGRQILERIRKEVEEYKRNPSFQKKAKMNPGNSQDISDKL